MCSTRASGCVPAFRRFWSEEVTDRVHVLSRKQYETALGTEFAANSFTLRQKCHCSARTSARAVPLPGIRLQGTALELSLQREVSNYNLWPTIVYNRKL